MVWLTKADAQALTAGNVDREVANATIELDYIYGQMYDQLITAPRGLAFPNTRSSIENRAIKEAFVPLLTQEMGGTKKTSCDLTAAGRSFRGTYEGVELRTQIQGSREEVTRRLLLIARYLRRVDHLCDSHDLNVATKMGIDGDLKYLPTIVDKTYNLNWIKVDLTIQLRMVSPRARRGGRPSWSEKKAELLRLLRTESQGLTKRSQESSLLPLTNFNPYYFNYAVVDDDALPCAAPSVEFQVRGVKYASCMLEIKSGNLKEAAKMAEEYVAGWEDNISPLFFLTEALSIYKTVTRVFQHEPSTLFIVGEG